MNSVNTTQNKTLIHHNSGFIIGIPVTSRALLIKTSNMIKHSDIRMHLTWYEHTLAISDGGYLHLHQSYTPYVSHPGVLIRVCTLLKIIMIMINDKFSSPRIDYLWLQLTNAAITSHCRRHRLTLSLLLILSLPGLFWTLNKSFHQSQLSKDDDYN